ncbi:gluconate 2-dehydrogenase subunit 3 family protein [Sphingobium sp. DEHP117]|uniref:gluconate 2-dehydrogenase subunit 3 family protein n=1 Tax=Sphingobium sp. DEHP117 TaxID=2993436 RepID=UPI0027D4DE74|nr:gluconate 2-dehydrogenase subunit 3 family protein [Sphingobium sp. DEHP117]MDQ4420964.1 gluconate 2-dehydrogenase subunit 3 family protein [Sphingobium sp. DEHP117]
MDQSPPSRRQFLAAVGNLASAGWITLNWPQIAAAAEHSGHGGHGAHDAAPTTLSTLSPAEAAEVDAIVNQIVPGGATPGAREARVLYFIDNALGSFFAAQLPAFRQGLAEFGRGYAARFGADKPFSAAPDAQQQLWLQQVEKTPFFTAVRRLTVLGLIALPKYGGNHDNLGWKLIGVEDNHYWEPPFGYYDKDYPGFEPYPGTKPYTA